MASENHGVEAQGTFNQAHLSRGACWPFRHLMKHHPVNLRVH